LDRQLKNRPISFFISTLGTMSDDIENNEPREPRRENPIFTIWVATGYAVLILSMIGWMVYMEFFM